MMIKSDKCLIRCKIQITVGQCLIGEILIFIRSIRFKLTEYSSQNEFKIPVKLQLST